MKFCKKLQRPIGSVLWGLSLIALVFAWIASFRATGTFLALPVAHLYWDALVLGVLALGCFCNRKSKIDERVEESTESKEGV